MLVSGIPRKSEISGGGPNEGTAVGVRGMRSDVDEAVGVAVGDAGTLGTGEAVAGALGAG